MGLGSGFVNLFKNWGKGIGNAADNFWLGADAQKAIREEIEKKFQRRINRAHDIGSKRAENIKDLGDKLNESKKDLADAQKAWQDKYNSELAAAKTKRQTDIADYDAKLKGYQGALDTANADRQSIINQLYDQEASYNPTKTIYTDVNSGDKYIVDPITGKYQNITQIFSNNANKKQKQAISKYIKGFDERLLDTSSGTPKVINAFDEATQQSYRNNNIFDNYLGRVQSSRNGDIRTADNQIRQATDNLSTWQKSNSQPTAWDDTKDLKLFEADFKKNNGASPKGYSFNGQNYKSKSDLDKAYKDALAHEQNRKDLADEVASRYASKRDAEIAQRIQDAKDMNKAKVALGGTLGAGALYAGARAMYGGDNTDNTDTIDNVRPDPNFNIKNTPEVQAQLNDEQQPDTAPINTGFDPDKADALAAAAYDKGVEDGNSIESSGDLGNNIAAKTGGHTIDDGLFELLKAMENPYKADAIADYIYSRYGNDPDVQRLGWRGWLNKYYGDSLRSNMNIDPSGYNGMHIA